MRIRCAHAALKRVALKKPYAIAGASFSDVSMAFLVIELENGIRGVGCASPAEEVVGETAEDCHRNLVSGFTDGLAGADIRAYRSILRMARGGFPRSPGTLAAIDIALHDAYCRWAGIRVADLLGTVKDGLPTSLTIGIMPAEETLAAAEEGLRQGFGVLKLKTGEDVEEDVRRVRLLREAFGKDFSLYTDANRGYDLPALCRFLRETEGMGVELVEQPLPPGDDPQLLQLPERWRSRLAADESLLDADSARRLSQGERTYGVFNIKLMKCGGISAAMEIAAIARTAGIRLFWGCNDESACGISAALQAAYACPNTAYLDLDGSFDLAEDPAPGGFILRDGRMYLTEKPGLGVEWDAPGF